MKTMIGIAQIVIFGLLAGSIYSILGIGLTMIMGVGKILNISHGDMGILGAYFAYWLFIGVAVDPLLSLIAILPALLFIGMAIQRFLINPAVSDPKTRISASIMITYGLALFIQNMETIIWKPDYRFLDLPYAYSGFEIMGITVNLPRLIVLIVTAVVAVSLIALLRTKFGKTMQASAQNPLLAELVGIDRNRTAIITFGISTSLAGVAGVLYMLNNPLYPAASFSLTVKGLVVMVLGGIGRVGGALLAGLLLGLAEAFTSFYIGDVYRGQIAYLFLLAVLLIRPRGIFGSVEV